MQCSKLEYFEKFHPIATSAGYEYDIDPMFLLDSGFKLQASLGRKINNHFGIKCYRKTCPKGHCENYATEKSHKDFFIKYSNPNESFYVFAKMCRNWMNTHKKTCEYEFFNYYMNNYCP